MISIGLDLSINSTGVCVYDAEAGWSKYYIVGSKFTKKSLDYHNDTLHLIPYEKTVPGAKDEYHIKESIKTHNTYNIISALKCICIKYEPSVVSIEGVSFGSTGSAALIDLTGLNYMVRMMLEELHIPYYIISPTQNKKFATGNGQAEKDVMISAWHKLDKRTEEIPTYIKVDDIADAYFLARYGLSLLTQ